MRFLTGEHVTCSFYPIRNVAVYRNYRLRAVFVWDLLSWWDVGDVLVVLASVCVAVRGVICGVGGL